MKGAKSGLGKILRDLAHVVREKNGEQRGRTLNSYANEAVSCMAKSVADKLSKGEDVFFLLRIFYGNFGEIPPFTDNTKGNKMSQKEGEKTGILFFYRSSRDAGRYFGGGGDSVKTTY